MEFFITTQSTLFRPTSIRKLISTSGSKETATMVISLCLRISLQDNILSDNGVFDLHLAQYSPSTVKRTFWCLYSASWNSQNVDTLLTNNDLPTTFLIRQRCKCANLVIC